MTMWLERLRRKPPSIEKETLGKRYIHTSSILLVLIFLTTVGFAGGSIYLIVKKDNELEKSRRIELDLRNNIKERDYVIQQYRQRIQTLEKRVEIIDAIQELSAASVSKKDQLLIAKEVDETCSKYGQNPFLILAIMSTESSIRPWAASSVGASGLMQIMPSTGRYLSKQVKETPQLIGVKEDEEFDVPHYRNIGGNIELGTLYLTQLMLKYNSLEYAIYAYNLGPGLFEKRRATNGPYPRKYLAKIMKRYTKLVADHNYENDQVATALYSTNEINNLLVQAIIPIN
jgi:peptidoglycan lytic transglycosylase